MAYYRRMVLLAFLLGMSLFIVVGCDGQATPTASVADNITFQLSWTHEYSSAMFYTAVQNGHFANQNINLTIVEGGFGEAGMIEPIEQVLSGEADFGTASATSLIRARAEGKAIVGVATALQRNPFALISLQQNNIVSPSDLVGKTILVSDGGSRTRVLTFLAQQGISVDDVTLIPRITFGIEPLVNGEVDLLAGWIINEAVTVQEAGFEANFILLSDYGLDDYDFVLFTSQDTVDNRPEIVERFLRAFIAGTQDTIGNPSQATQAVLTYNSALNLEGQQNRLEVMLPLINPPGQQLGVMDLRVWEQSQGTLLSLGILDAPTDLNLVFTNAFLQKIYNAELGRGD